MKPSRVFALLGLAVSVMTPMLQAEDWTTTDGKVYQQVQVVSTQPDSVTILHQDGGAAVPMEKLPPAVQQRFNYDPAKAKAYRDAQNKPAAPGQVVVKPPPPGFHEKVPGAAAPNPMDDPENVLAADPPAPPPSPTPAPATPPPAQTDATHYGADSLSGPTGTLRRDLKDPNYHTMAHLTTTVQSLGPDPSDKNHHSMDQFDGGL